MNVHTIIERGGGVSQFAAKLSVSHSTVCNWKRTGFVPGHRAVQISQALGLPLESVAALVRRPAEPESAARAPRTARSRSRLMPEGLALATPKISGS